MPKAIERLLSTPVTRIFLPERRGIGRLYFRGVRSLLVLALLFFWIGAHAADPSKILRITFQAAETGFDPVRVSDYYSGTVIEGIFDPLLTYDYLARPAKLVPNTAEALPEISEQGRVYTIRVKQGIYFADDAALRARGASSPPRTMRIRSAASS